MIYRCKIGPICDDAFVSNTSRQESESTQFPKRPDGVKTCNCNGGNDTYCVRDACSLEANTNIPQENRVLAWVVVKSCSILNIP